MDVAVAAGLTPADVKGTANWPIAALGPLLILRVSALPPRAEAETGCDHPEAECNHSDARPREDQQRHADEHGGDSANH